MRRGGGKGILIQDDQTGTLSTVNNQAVCYDKTIAIEGNGVRESHLGTEYAESDVMYTLNTVEQHSVCYAKTAKPRNADEAPTIVESDIAPTLGTHDISEARQNQYVVFPESDTMQTLTANNAGGQQRMPDKANLSVICVKDETK